MDSVSTESSAVWNDLATARAYEAFNERHTRYIEANRELVERAGIAAGHCVLDFAAGTGRTAEAALRRLGEDDRVVCVEPSEAMRRLGQERLQDERVCWRDELPEDEREFDRVLCGAAIWQCLPLIDSLPRLAKSLAPGGALCFNIPAAYVGEPDEPGGGRDPYLLGLQALLSGDRPPRLADSAPLPSAAEIDDLLADCGLGVQRWAVETRVTQEAYRDWLKIPVIGTGLLDDVDPEKRSRLIDAAYECVDKKSWRWERWWGWTGWRSLSGADV